MAFLLNLDRSILEWINKDMANPVFDALMPAITDLHKTQQFKFFFLPAFILLLLFFYRSRGAFILAGLVFSLSLSDIIGNIGKQFWERPRPFLAGLDVIQRSSAGNFSFPSNHAINIFCTAFFLSAFFPKFRWFFLIFASLVAYSRVYNAVHYPSDVVVGIFLGSFVGILGSKVTKILFEKFENFWKNRGSRRHA